MGPRTQLFLLLVFIQCLVMAVRGASNINDFNGLQSFRDSLQNTPPNWVGSDPCGGNWNGIVCTNSRVTSLILTSMNLTGSLSSEIQLLSALQTLDLSYNKGIVGTLPNSIGSLSNLLVLNLVGCGFFGPIPDTIGSLKQLSTLSLTSNSFSGPIPASIGNLSNIFWLDLANNQLEGQLPVSNGITPGLDMLLQAVHFHFDNNQLSGTIPLKLFSSNMILIHVLLNNNNLTGSIPSTLGTVQTLEVVRFDRNSLSGSIPSNLTNLSQVSELFLSNNKLNGTIPDLTGMKLLNTLDMSNNSFDVSDVPTWISTLQSLTTLVMENTQLQGQVPVGLFSFPNLQMLVLRNNNLSGTLDIGTSYSNQLQLINLQNNSITGFTDRVGGYNRTLILADNPYCNAKGTLSYCIVSQSQSNSNPPYSTPSNNCVPSSCSSNQVSSPNCKCAYPYIGTLVAIAPGFSDLSSSSNFVALEVSLMQYFQSNKFPVDSVSLSNPIMDSVTKYLEVRLQIFPSGQDLFNQTEISRIASQFSNHSFEPPYVFVPYRFYPDVYYAVAYTKSKSLSIGVIIGAVAGGSILLLLLLVAGVYALRQKRRAERASEQLNPFANWDTNGGSGGIPQLKGSRWFSFEELKKYTNKFSEDNSIGSGGYGKVYLGTLPNGQLIAIKRAQRDSMQGGLEFKTEIELLSRVHHTNLVSLVGFCFDQGEQMLIYEYVPNGTLKDSLSGKSGIRLDWMRRLKIALGAAKGLAYLHELANPPIIHRDIKSTNLLLDDHLNAKVADFGLSKLVGDAEKGHVSTEVKGTMGYLDPEYYMTHQLSEKSDVYSFGVLMLELLTARMPIERGKFIVRVVRTAMDRTKDLYNLHEILDPAIGLKASVKGLEKLVDLALRCVEEAGADRPAMSEVVKEIENIMQLAGLNPKVESTSTSASFDEVSKGNSHHPYSNEAFEYSGAFPLSKVEPS